MSAPLAGHGVLLTRPKAQAGPLMQQLEAAGARVHCLPVLELSAFEGPGLAAALSEYSQAALALFVSANAVQFGLAALARQGIALSGPQLVAVGQATARALEAAGGGPVLTAGAGSDSEALLALPRLRQVAGQTVILFRGDSESGGRTLLRDSLGTRGARVLEATCYRRAVARIDPQARAAVLQALAAGQIQAVQVMSGESLAALLEGVVEQAVGVEGARRPCWCRIRASPRRRRLLACPMRE
jgi:uroporphyrinogen-III synthase